jgi:ketosteroid isomerase-like protein
MPTTDHADVIRSLFDSFNSGNLARAASLVTEDFELVDVAAGLTFHGPEGLLQWFQGFLTAGPDARTEILTTIVAGDWVATEHIGRFTHTGPLLTPGGEIAPTGRKVELQIAEIYQLREGNLSLLRAYYDAATMMRQLGLLP